MMKTTTLGVGLTAVLGLAMLSALASRAEGEGGLVAQVKAIATQARAAAPVGIVMAWPGPVNTIPAGWALCDGRSFAGQGAPGASNSGLDAKGLRTALGTASSNPYGPDKLPDYRGLFLRGSNGSRKDGWRDPDAADRRSHVGGRTKVGARVGSIQNHEVIRHRHYKSTGIWDRPSTQLPGGISMKNGNRHLNQGFAVRFSSNGTELGKMALPYGGHETRPRNVYVNWIIRVK